MQTLPDCDAQGQGLGIDGTSDVDEIDRAGVLIGRSGSRSDLSGTARAQRVASPWQTKVAEM